MNLIPLGIRRVLSHKDYVYFITAQITVLLSFWMQNAASAWLVYSLTGSGVLLGMVAFFFLVPSLFLAPIGGMLADKFVKKHVLYCTQIISALSSFILALLIFSDIIQVWHIMLHSFVLGSALSIEGPNRNAFMVELVGRDDLQNAIALNSSVFNLGKMLGPALSGGLIAFIDIGLIYFFTALSFLMLCYALFKISVDGRPIISENNTKQRTRDGFIYAYKDKTIFYSLLLIGISSIAVTPSSVLLPIIAAEILGGQSLMYGTLSSATGVGSFITAVYLASRIKNDNSIKLINLGSCLICLSLGVLSFSNNLWISLLAFLALGIGQVLQAALINSLIQTITPEMYKGRVLSLLYMMWLGLGVFGSFLAGALNDLFGTHGTMLACFMILGLSCIVLLPNLTKSSSQKYSELNNIN